MEFFDTASAAEAAGYRASRRYSGDRSASAERRASLVTAACRLIEASEQAPTLTELGERVGMSPFHLQRVFKAAVGVSPKAYALASRARKLRQQLGNQDGSTTNAIFDAGFNSSGHFYATAGRHLGMSADAFRNGGVGTSISYALCECSLGLLLVAQGGLGVCAVLLGADAQVLIDTLEAQFPRAFLKRGDQAHEEQLKRVIALVDVPRVGLGLPLDVRATAFQERAWKVFRAIPVGTVAIAHADTERIVRAGAARSVARDGAAIRISTVIPRRRVVRGHGCTRRTQQRGDSGAIAGKEPGDGIQA